MKALIIDRVSPVIAKGLQALGAEVDIKILPSVDELKEMLPEYDLLVMRVDPKIGRDILDAAAKRVKMIAVCAAGTNHIDLEYARELGIRVQNARESTVTRLRCGNLKDDRFVPLYDEANQGCSRKVSGINISIPAMSWAPCPRHNRAGQDRQPGS
ncbi:MAG: hypothetical protein ACLUOI_23490 [Eisenbergiella sp.]